MADRRPNKKWGQHPRLGISDSQSRQGYFLARFPGVSGSKGKCCRLQSKGGSNKQQQGMGHSMCGALIALLVVGIGYWVFIASRGWTLHARSESTEDGTVRDDFPSILLLCSVTVRDRPEQDEISVDGSVVDSLES